MANEDLLGVEETPVDVAPLPVEEGVEAPLEEEALVEEEAPGTVMTHTADDIPELADKAVGDVLSFEVTDINDDGVYELSIVPEIAETEGEVAGGREAVLGALTGGGVPPPVV